MTNPGDPQILPLRLGTQTTYLIPARDGFVMVDAGNRRCEAAFVRGLKRLDIRPDRIKLLILTHIHFDHVGNAAFIQEVTGCQVAAHLAEAHLMESGQAVIPPGVNWYGRLVSNLGRALGTHHFNYPGVRVDLPISGRHDLSGFGLAGRIIETPGHTAGSISVILDSGQAIAGDAIIRYLPFLPPFRPPFGNDKARMLQSWKTLLETGTETIYPGHGWPIGVGELKRRYERLRHRVKREGGP